MSAPTAPRLVLKWIGILVALAALSGVGLRLAGAADPAATPPAPGPTSPGPTATSPPPTPTSPAPAATPDEAAPPKTNPPIDAKGISAILGVTGELKDGVYHVTVPRSDLIVNVEGMPVPTEAGLASVFHFWVCVCGKTVVYGDFCLADYEANDVIDALRAGGMRVTAASNILIGENPKLMSVRFYCEGDALEMAKALKAALKNTGDARNEKQPIK